MTRVKLNQSEEIDESLASDDLPEGWALITLRRIAEQIQYGYTASAIQSEGPRFLRITDIQDGTVDWTSVPSCEITRDDTEKYHLIAGDIVFARTGATTGKSFLIRFCPQAVFASYLIRVRAHKVINPAFLSFFLNTPPYWEFITNNVAGNAQPNCNASKLAALQIPIAPAAEQTRIVAKVEALLAEVNRVRARLEKVPKILKAFRQSVLAAACSGRLTENWRRSRSNIPSVFPLVDSRHKAAADWYEPCFDIRTQAELPSDWTFIALGNLGEWGSGGTPSKSRDDYWKEGRIPWVSPKDMKTEIIRDSRDHITKQAAADSNLKLIPRGSIVFVVRGLILAHTFPVAMTAAPFTVNQDIRYLVPHDEILPAFLLRTLQNEARSILFAVRESTHGTRRLESPTLKLWPIPIPPVDEQQEVICRVDALFDLADTIEKQVESATKRAEKITQAILAKAFRGELIPTEAELARRESRSYEPASALLERIKSEHKKKPVDTSGDTLPHRRRAPNSRGNPRSASG